MIVITSDNIRELRHTGRLTFARKSQKTQGDFNYYITPNLALNLYGGKVIDSNPKYLVIQFDKYQNINLLQLLRTTSTNITDYLKECFGLSDVVETVYPLFVEGEVFFNIRVYLPHVRNKYFIETCVDEVKTPFKLPNRGVVIPSARVEIRNLWQNKSRIGFNLELKSVNF